MANNAAKNAQFSGATVTLRVPVQAEKTAKATKEPKRLHAHAINRILDRQSGELVGWLYEWNTGERVPRWKKNAEADVIYE